MIASAQMFFILYITMYTLTSLPGDKLHAGMTFGIAESSSNLLSSFICTKVKDSHAFSFFGMMIIVSQTIFYFICEGKTGGLLALTTIFCTAFGSGSNVNLTYLMIQNRIPTQKLGSAVVVVITGAVFYSTFSS
jgi:hypothetical protein